MFVELKHFLFGRETAHGQDNNSLRLYLRMKIKECFNFRITNKWESATCVYIVHQYNYLLSFAVIE